MSDNAVDCLNKLREFAHQVGNASMFAGVNDLEELIVEMRIDKNSKQTTIDSICHKSQSEFWKSQPRKFCDFCKCWITDNKPSVEFHEKGKRHQENVRLRIQEVKKKGTAAAKKKLEEDDYMKQMEKAALEAFKKDLEDNPDLAKQYKVKLPEVGPQLPPPGYVDETAEKEEETNGRTDSDGQTDGQTSGDWYEAMSEMGYPYYWNTVTGESVWVAPEKYVSLADQGLAPPTDSDKTEEDKEEPDKGNVPVEDIPVPHGVESIPLPGETGPESPPSPPSPEESSEEEEEEEEDIKQDRHARGVYGTWARVQKQEPEFVDLQLPKTSIPQEVIAIPVLEEPKVKFKEKQITSLGSNKSGPVAFKKRKLGDVARNVRKRGNDDD